MLLELLSFVIVNVFCLCICGEINLYHSFCWNNLILCLHNIDTLNICVKKLDAKILIFWQNDSFTNSQFIPFFFFFFFSINRGYTCA